MELVWVQAAEAFRWLQSLRRFLCCAFAHVACTFACTLSSLHFCCELACWFVCICKSDVNEVMLPASAHCGARCMDVHGAPKQVALCERVFRTVDLGSRIQARPRAGESSCTRFHHAERRGAMVGHSRLAKNRRICQHGKWWRSSDGIRDDQS